MEISITTLIWFVRLIYFLFVGLFAFFLWHYLRREWHVHIVPKPVTQPQLTSLPEKVLVLQLRARPGYFFDKTQLQKQLLAVGLQLSSEQVFEYPLHESLPNLGLNEQNNVAFSIINSRGGGRFELNNTRIPIDALVAVMILPILDGFNQLKFFHLLVAVLESLRTSLDAQLCDRAGHPLKETKLYQMQQEVERFEEQYFAVIRQHDQVKKTALTEPASHKAS